MTTSDRQHSVLGDIPLGVNAYSPYGVLGAAIVPGLAFCGPYHDLLTASYPLGNGRCFYSPTLMRFMAYDSMSPRTATRKALEPPTQQTLLRRRITSVTCE